MGTFDDFDIAQQTPEVTGIDTSFSEAQRGALGSTLSLLGRAGISAGETIENSLEFFGLNDPEKDTVSKLRQIDFFKPDLDEKLNRGILKDTVLGSIPSAFESIGPSLIAAGTGAAIGTAIAPVGGTVVGGLIGGAVSLFGLMGSSAYQQTYEQEIARGVPEDQARDTAGKIGFIEGAGEAAAGLVGLGGLGKFMGKPVKQTLRQLMSIGPAALAKEFGKIYSGEQITEMLQNTAENKVLMDAGYDINSVLEGNLKTVIPTLFMSGAFQMGTNILNSKQKSTVLSALKSEDSNIQQRAADVVYNQLAKEDSAIALNWKAFSDQAIANKEPISVNTDFSNMFEQVQAKQDAPLTTEEILTAPTETITKKVNNELGLTKPKPVREPIQQTEKGKQQILAAKQRQEQAAKEEELKRQLDIKIKNDDKLIAEAVARRAAKQRTQEETDRVVNAIVARKVAAQKEYDRNLAGLKSRIPSTAQEAAKVFETTPLTPVQKTAEKRADVREAFTGPSVETANEPAQTSNVVETPVSSVEKTTPKETGEAVVKKAGTKALRFGPVVFQRFDPTKGNIFHIIEQTDTAFDPTKLEKGYTKSVTEGVLEKDVKLLKTADTDGELHTNNIAEALIKENVTETQRAELESIITQVEAGVEDEISLEKRVVEIARELGYDGHIYDATEGGTGIGIFSDKIAAVEEDIADIIANVGSDTGIEQGTTPTISAEEVASGSVNIEQAVPTTQETVQGEATKPISGEKIKWRRNVDLSAKSNKSEEYIGELPGSKFDMSIFRTEAGGSNFTAVVRDITKKKSETFPDLKGLTAARKFVEDMFGDLGSWNGTSKTWRDYEVVKLGTDSWRLEKDGEEIKTFKSLREAQLQAMQEEGQPPIPWTNVEKGKVVKTGIEKVSKEEVPVEPVKTLTGAELEAAKKASLEAATKRREAKLKALRKEATPKITVVPEEKKLPTSKPKTLEEVVKSFSNAKEAVDWLSKNSKSTFYRLVATRIKGLVSNKTGFIVSEVGVTYNREGTPKIASEVLRNKAKGVYDPEDNLISILGINEGNKNTDRHGVSEETILHELIHSVTSDIIRFNEGARKELLDLHTQIISHINSLSTEEFSKLPIKLTRGNTDAHEILAWGLTNSQYQELLNEIKVTPTETLWSKFVSLVGSLLGFPVKTNSALSELLKVSDKLFKAVEIEGRIVPIEQRGKKLLQELNPEREARILKAMAEARDQRTTAEKYKDSTKEFLDSAAKGVSSLITPLTTRLGNINTQLSSMMKIGEAKKSRNIKRHEKAALPFLREIKKLSLEDYDRVRSGLLNSERDFARAEEVFNRKPKLKKTYDQFKKDVLDDLEKLADKAGLLPEKIENYFPRVVEDARSLFNSLREEKNKPQVLNQIEKVIEKQRKKVESSGGILTERDVNDIIAKQIHSGRFNVIREPGASKTRALNHIPEKQLQYYASIEDSILTHIQEMNESLFVREVTGKTGRQAKLHRMRKVAKSIEKAADPERKRRLEAIWSKLNSQVRDIEEDTVNALGPTMRRLNLSPEDQQEAVRLVRARVLQKGMFGAPLVLKNVGLAITIGNPLSAITQLGDQALNIYKNKGDAFGGMFKALTSKDISDKFALDNVLQEFGKVTETSKALDRLLSWSGLKQLDMFGKESLMQGALSKWSKASEEEFSKRFSSFEPFLEGSLQEAQQSMKDGNLNNDALDLLFAELSDTQPVSLSETSEKFLGAGNLRLFYMLKQFSLKQIDNIVRETTKEWKSGDTKGKVKAVRNFIGLVGLLGLAGAGTDEIKNLLLGRQGEALPDAVASNLMQLLFINRYALEQGAGSGKLINDYLAGILVPPVFRPVDLLVRDVVKTVKDGGKVSYTSMSTVPMVGRFAYSRFTEQGKEAEVKRIRADITKGIKEAMGGRVSDRLRKNILLYNKQARQFDMKPVSLSKLLKQARQRERNK